MAILVWMQLLGDVLIETSNLITTLASQAFDYMLQRGIKEFVHQIRLMELQGAFILLQVLLSLSLRGDVDLTLKKG